MLIAVHLVTCFSQPQVDASLPPHQFDVLPQHLSSRHPLSFLSEISGDSSLHRVHGVIHMVS